MIEIPEELRDMGPSEEWKSYVDSMRAVGWWKKPDLIKMTAPNASMDTLFTVSEAAGRFASNIVCVIVILIFCPPIVIWWLLKLLIYFPAYLTKLKTWDFVQLHYPHSPQKNNTNG